MVQLPHRLKARTLIKDEEIRSLTESTDIAQLLLSLAEHVNMPSSWDATLAM